MNIPHDAGHPWRLDKFIEYQNKVPPIHTVTCVEYARRHDLDADDCVYLAWLISVTYCEITAIHIFEELSWRTLTLERLEKYWRVNKPKLLFNSSRAYAKSMDWFVPLVESFMKRVKRHPHRWVESYKSATPLETYNRIMAETLKIKYTGRFAADLFLEMLLVFGNHNLIPMKLKEPEWLDWRRCSNLTSGLFNVLYMDEEADLFDKTGVVSREQIALLNKRVVQILKAIQRRYPEQEADLCVVVTKLCSFRNLFKSSRYGGFHHDRQLENIYQYMAWYPNSKLWAELFEIRAALFPQNLLGEVGGWKGVRKERKKLWIEKGLTGVEIISKHKRV